MRICRRFRFFATVLFLSISSYAFSKSITIEGKGIVCINGQMFEEGRLYFFGTSWAETVHFRIKPEKQFYLDSLLIYRDSMGWDTLIVVSRDSIYAERDDTLHYYHYGHSYGEGYSFHFVFKEVQPWSGERAVAYKSRDKSYMQIYRPEELFDSAFTSVVSLQNDLDLANNIDPYLYIGSFCHGINCAPHSSTIRGNN